MQHYHHLEFYIPITRGTRELDAYVYIPANFELPENTTADRAIKFAIALKSPATKHFPFDRKIIKKSLRYFPKYYY